MAVDKTHWWKPPPNEPIRFRMLPPYQLSRINWFPHQIDAFQQATGQRITLRRGREPDYYFYEVEKEQEPMAATEPIQSAYDIEQKLVSNLSFIFPENTDAILGYIEVAILKIKDLIARCFCRIGTCAECEYNKSVLLRVERMLKAQQNSAVPIEEEEEDPDAINRIVDEEPYEVDEQG